MSTERVTRTTAELARGLAPLEEGLKATPLRRGGFRLGRETLPPDQRRLSATFVRTILISLKSAHSGAMTNSAALTSVVRYAVETAQVEWIQHSKGTHLGEVHFGVTARSRIQEAATTADRLMALAEACDEELLHQIGNVESIDGAAAAMRLKAALPSITHPRKRWIMERDGSFRPET